MKAHRRTTMVSTALATLLIAGCTSTGPKPKPSGSVAAVPRGGTLRVGYPASIVAPLTDTVGLDPQRDYFFDSWEFFRCCLLRTLLSHQGRPTREGGALLQPDLATALPEISADGQTWTFHIRPGLHYAPPLQNVEITAPDFIRALQREAQPKIGGQGYGFYYSIISGFDDYGAGRSASIAGLEAPDPRTLRVHLTHPAGDLADLFALAATAPIPPNPADALAPFGIAQGHDDDFGSFLVSSGPYMLEGSGALDFSKAPAQQVPVSGYVPKRSIVMVRNPSWIPASDPLRPAYVDRIEIRLGGSLDGDVRQQDQGTLDLMINGGPPIQAPVDAVHAYENDPSKGTVDTEPRDFIRYVSMNLAVPPFDDIHVRKAVNYVVDKQALIDARGGPLVGNVINHISLDSLENNLLSNYDPYPSPAHHGDVARARAEMAQSSYDRNHDGVCDAAVCRHVLALSFPPPWVAVSKSIARDFRQIGIALDVHAEDSEKVFASLQDPKSRIPLALNVAWGRDILNASNYFAPLFDSSQIGNPAAGNYALLGASSAQLRRWGYTVRQVPTVDDRIDACLSKVGQSQLQCWSELDQYLMEDVVPWVPYVSENHVQLVPSRIANYSFDQFTGLPALDQIALKPGT